MADEDIIISGGLGDDEIEDLDELEELDEGGPEDDSTPALRKLYSAHPECLPDYVEQVLLKVPLQSGPPRTVSALEAAAKVMSTETPQNQTEGSDPNHKTYPFLNKYEATRIIGFRANQLSQGAQPFVDVPDHVTDVREIARMELAAKRLPFIIKRPLPDGTYEYWRLQDLLQI
jgi:DNA-directed RNA polymerase I, II, and III subunit RPABC2